MEEPLPIAPSAPGRGRRLAALVGVLILCGALRLWLVAHSDLIARDGTALVASAKRFDRDAVGEIKTSLFHPAYPASIVGVRRVLLACGADAEQVWTWDLSGQVVSLGAALLATLGLWLFAERLLNWPIAFVSVLLMSLTRKWSALGADVLADALAICFQVWGALLALIAAERLADGRKRALAWAAGVGVLTAAAYLVRPEAIFIGPVAASLWLANIARKRAPWRLSLAVVLLAALTAALCAGPYMLTIGAFSRKTSVLKFLPPPAASPTAASVWPLAASAGDSGVHQIIDQLTISLHLILSVLALVCVVTWLSTRVRRLRTPDRVRIFPSCDGVILMLAAVALPAGPLIHYAHIQKLSHRYLMFQALLLSPLAGAGLTILGQYLQIAADRLGRPVRQAQTVFAVIVAALAAGLMAHSLRPLHQGKGNFRTAAAFVREITTPDDFVASTEPWILHYGGRPGWYMQNKYLTRPGSLPRFLRNYNVTHFVFCRHRNPKEGELEVELDTPHLAHLRTFPPSDRSGTTIIVYRVERGEWGPRTPKRP